MLTIIMPNITPATAEIGKQLARHQTFGVDAQAFLLPAVFELREGQSKGAETPLSQDKPSLYLRVRFCRPLAPYCSER